MMAQPMAVQFPVVPNPLQRLFETTSAVLDANRQRKEREKERTPEYLRAIVEYGAQLEPDKRKAYYNSINAYPGVHQWLADPRNAMFRDPTTGGVLEFSGGSPQEKAAAELQAYKDKGAIDLQNEKDALRYKQDLELAHPELRQGDTYGPALMLDEYALLNSRDPESLTPYERSKLSALKNQFEKDEVGVSKEKAFELALREYSLRTGTIGHQTRQDVENIPAEVWQRAEEIYRELNGITEADTSNPWQMLKQARTKKDADDQALRQQAINMITADNIERKKNKQPLWSTDEQNIQNVINAIRKRQIK